MIYKGWKGHQFHLGPFEIRLLLTFMATNLIEPKRKQTAAGLTEYSQHEKLSFVFLFCP